MNQKMDLSHFKMKLTIKKQMKKYNNCQRI